MREAIITIIDTETVDGVTYATTEVHRVEFEGDAGITTKPDTDSFELGKVVNCERLAASTMPQHQYTRTH